MQLIDGPIAQNSAKGLIRLLEQAAEEFNQMTLDRTLPKVSYGSQVPPTETVIPPFDEGL